MATFTGKGVTCSPSTIDVCGESSCCAYIKMIGEPNLTVKEFSDASKLGFNYSDGAVNYGCYYDSEADSLGINFTSVKRINFKDRVVYDAICVLEDFDPKDLPAVEEETDEESAGATNLALGAMAASLIMTVAL